MRYVRIVAATVFASALLFISLSYAQTPSQKPKFEVVSIKPSGPGSFPSSGGTDGDRFVMQNTTVKVLLQVAYRTLSPGGADVLLRADQVLGGPAWIDSDRFDVEAKIGCKGGIASDVEIKLMVQSMLEDRFQLKAHYEKRDLPVYDLVAAKGGPKMKMSQDQTRAVFPAEFTTLPPCAKPPAETAAVRPAIDSRAIPRGILLVTRSSSIVMMTGMAVPIADLVNLLQGQAGRLVVDKTGMKELFDIKLSFSKESSRQPVADVAQNSPSQAGGDRAMTDSNLPDLFTAIREQLGLTLESTKGMLNVLVIDSVQRPAEN
jgi:uncharacterized protein (TIGR03435 family)